MTRFLGLVLLLSPAPGLASPADLCDAAAEQAAAENGVPLALMRAVTRVETGRDNAPWPWTLNIAGTPYRFATRQAACHALLQALARHDAKRVDAGLGDLTRTDAVDGQAMLRPLAGQGPGEVQHRALGRMVGLR